MSEGDVVTVPADGFEDLHLCYGWVAKPDVNGRIIATNTRLWSVSYLDPRGFVGGEIFPDWGPPGDLPLCLAREMRGWDEKAYQERLQGGHGSGG